MGKFRIYMDVRSTQLNHGSFKLWGNERVVKQRNELLDKQINRN
jgi:hypothetical protein